MKRLIATTALALVTGSLAFGAQAQDAAGDKVSTACTEAWKQVDADGNGTVSAEEARSYLDTAFSQIDIDGNDAISRQEYRDCYVRNTDMSAWLERREEDFNEADTDGDGQIAMNEFRSQSEEAYDRLQVSGNDPAADRSWVRHYIWLTPDEVSDNDLLENMSKDEFAGRSAYTFQSLDRNNDDMVSMEEWTDRTSASGRNEARADARFDEMDADSSKALTREEFSSQQSTSYDMQSTASTSSDASASQDGKGKSGSEVPVFLYVYELF